MKIVQVMSMVQIWIYIVSKCVEEFDINQVEKAGLSCLFYKLLVYK